MLGLRFTASVLAIGAGVLWDSRLGANPFLDWSETPNLGIIQKVLRP